MKLSEINREINRAALRYENLVYAFVGFFWGIQFSVIVYGRRPDWLLIIVMLAVTIMTPIFARKWKRKLGQ